MSQVQFSYKIKEVSVRDRDYYEVYYDMLGKVCVILDESEWESLKKAKQKLSGAYPTGYIKGETDGKNK